MLTSFKIKLTPLLFIILSVSCTVAHAQFPECKKPLLLSSDANWPPFIYIDKNNKGVGTDLVLLKNILALMQCKVKLAPIPERRVSLERTMGRFDIGLGATKTKERLLNLYFSSQYRVEVNKFAYRTQDMDIAAITNLNKIIELKKAIAINLGGWFGREIENAKNTTSLFVYTGTVERRIKMLQRNRVDIVIDDKTVLCHVLKASTSANISIHPLVLSKAPQHFVFNKETISPEFVEQFNSILDSMILSGELSAHYADNLPPECLKGL